jgi:hypothetical protein
MKLVPEWGRVLRYAWSIRLNAIAAIFSGLEIGLPYFEPAFPQGIFAGLAIFTSVAANFARLAAQKGITNVDK